jgi:GT2 family glycosyltransferase
MNDSFGERLLTISIVSHGQASLVSNSLDDLENFSETDFEVILTCNIPEDVTSIISRCYPIQVIVNDAPKGFGANHNAAFELSQGRFFAVVNPDIRVDLFDLSALTDVLSEKTVGLVVPKVVSVHGQVEDSVRRFPTWLGLFKRLVLQNRSIDYFLTDEPTKVDWAGGMFMLFSPKAFKDVGGFDDRRFFMYMEDVDICKRLASAGYAVVIQPKVTVVHDAQRASRRNLKHLRWHVTSAIRYLTGI